MRVGGCAKRKNRKNHCGYMILIMVSQARVMMAECEFFKKIWIVVGVAIKIVKIGMNMHNKGVGALEGKTNVCVCVLQEYDFANVV